MTIEWPTRPLAEVTQVRPPVAEARRRLDGDASVSFVPMEDLGIDQKFLIPKRTKPLQDVAGSYTYFADGDVLLAKITPCFENGKLGIAAGLRNGVGFGSSEYVVLRPLTGLTPEWLYYYLSREAFRVEGASHMAGAVGHRRVAKDFVDGYPIPVPALSEQQRIVGVLDEAFAAIATARANTEQNLRNARELVGASTESRFPAAAQDQVGARTLAELCDLIVDCEHKTAPTQDEGIPSIRTPNIGKGRLILDDVNRVSDATYRAWTRRAEPKAGDLILAREAPAGNVAVIPDGLKVCLGQRTVLLRPDRSVFEPAYLAHLLLQRDSQRRLLAGQRGATVQHVNVQDIRAFRVSGVPSLMVQQGVVQKIDTLLEAGDALEAGFQQKLAALDALKQSLLHQAFTGAL